MKFNYLTLEELQEYYNYEPDADIEPKAETYLEFASDKINLISGNRIQSIGFENLSETQQELTKKATGRYAWWLMTQGQEWFKGSVSVSASGFSTSSGESPEPDYVIQDIYSLLQQADLYYRRDYFDTSSTYGTAGTYDASNEKFSDGYFSYTSYPLSVEVAFSNFVRYDLFTVTGGTLTQGVNSDNKKTWNLAVTALPYDFEAGEGLTVSLDNQTVTYALESPEAQYNFTAGQGLNVSNTNGTINYSIIDDFITVNSPLKASFLDTFDIRLSFNSNFFSSATDELDLVITSLIDSDYNDGLRIVNNKIRGAQLNTPEQNFLHLNSQNQLVAPTNSLHFSQSNNGTETALNIRAQDGIVGSVNTGLSASSTQPLAVKLSGINANNNAITFGSDGGIYANPSGTFQSSTADFISLNASNVVTTRLNAFHFQRSNLGGGDLTLSSFNQNGIVNVGGDNINTGLIVTDNAPARVKVSSNSNPTNALIFGTDGGLYVPENEIGTQFKSAFYQIPNGQIGVNAFYILPAGILNFINNNLLFDGETPLVDNNYAVRNWLKTNLRNLTIKFHMVAQNTAPTPTTVAKVIDLNIYTFNYNNNVTQGQVLSIAGDGTIFTSINYVFSLGIGLDNRLAMNIDQDIVRFLINATPNLEFFGISISRIG